MQKFYEVPENITHDKADAPIKYYFSKYEETYDGDSIMINGILRDRFLELTDKDLWKICFGGLRLERFEVARRGLRVEIIAKMRDLEEVRKDIREDKKKGIRI